MSEDYKALGLVSDILNKFTDKQRESIEELKKLNSSMQEAMSNLDKIESHFTNGFRSEIKDHIDEQSEKIVDKINIIGKKVIEINRDLDTLKKSMQKPWYWIKLFASLIIAIATLAATIILAFKNPDYVLPKPGQGNNVEISAPTDAT